MNKEDFKKLLRKCFGKEKDDRYHAIAMLIIYGIFLFAFVLMVRFGGTTTDSSTVAPTPTPTPTPIINDVPDVVDENDGKEQTDNSEVINDVNYSYIYTVTKNGFKEIFTGKRVDDKEKFTYITNETNKDYAILSDNYLVLENGEYHITDSISSNFKYCDLDGVLSLINEMTPVNEGNIYTYTVKNSDLASIYEEDLLVTDNGLNTIKLITSGMNLKGAELDLTNYIKALEAKEGSLKIRIEYASVGATEDFEINVE